MIKPNPFAVTSLAEKEERGIFADRARLQRSGFLYRVIDFDPKLPRPLAHDSPLASPVGSIASTTTSPPLSGRFVYSGWWFRQLIQIDGQRMWFRVSWLTIHSRAQFTLPATIDPLQRDVMVEIRFGRGLLIRRFRIWLSDAVVYDEIH